MSAMAAAFDALAADYDRIFTDRPIGRRLRTAVWRHLDCQFQPGMRVVDLGCGTAADAAYLASRGIQVAALDPSGAMIERARSRIDTLGLGQRVTLQQAELEQAGALLKPDGSNTRRFDGALANFGVFNCLSDWTGAFEQVARLLRPGAPFVVVAMGPRCAWEWLYFGLRGDLKRASRRRAADLQVDLGSGAFRVRYPSPRQLAQAADARFDAGPAAAIGLLLPPPDAAGWLERRPRLLAGLDRLERRIEAWPGSSRLSDHYLMTFQRRQDHE